MTNVPTEKMTEDIHYSASLLLFTTTNVRHSSQNHTLLQKGWNEELLTFLHRREHNPVVSGVVKETTQLLARDTVDIGERQLGCVQPVMCHYERSPDSMGRAVLFSSTNPRHCLTHVWQRCKAYKWRSARMATDVQFRHILSPQKVLVAVMLGGRKGWWWQEIPIPSPRMTKAVTSIL